MTPAIVRIVDLMHQGYGREDIIVILDGEIDGHTRDLVNDAFDVLRDAGELVRCYGLVAA